MFYHKRSGYFYIHEKKIYLAKLKTSIISSELLHNMSILFAKLLAQFSIFVFNSKKKKRNDELCKKE